jgi:hypothetical protein
MAVYSYPSPRAPRYEKPKGIEDCLPQARALVRKILPHEQASTVYQELHGGRELLCVREGDKVLIVTLPDQDKYVAEAITQAMMEQGAEKVDWIYPLELVGEDPKTYSLEAGWREIGLYEEGKASGSPIDIMTGQDLGRHTREYLDKHPEYTAVFVGVGGGNELRSMQHHRGKLRGQYQYNNWEWFLARGHRFPLEVWHEFERRLKEPLSKASRVRITDPEGTHLEYSVSAEEAARWHLGVQGGFQHLSFNPLMATCHELREFKLGRGETLDAPPVFPKLSGVLAGTANHCGYIPRMETYFEQDRLVAVKGGGRFGDGIRELMDKYQDIHWPHYPDKGLFWFCDSALCTAIGTFRRTSDMFNSYWIYPNLPERTAPGVFHHGFGSRIYGTEKEFYGYGQKHGLHPGHIHGGHNYFSTFEVKLRGTNYWLKLVDKGWITALGDPEVRALAAKYGVPDELLGYDWIPPIPGINCEGDYMKDYAPDPLKYLKKRMEGNKPI